MEWRNSRSGVEYVKSRGNMEARREWVWDDEIREEENMICVKVGSCGVVLVVVWASTIFRMMRNNKKL